MKFEHHAIGFLSTPFKEKFGVPRQSMMMSAARGVLKLKPDPAYALALKHLDQFTHIWLIFIFHKSGTKPWHPLIETPRIEAAQRMGVFATRSPHRPNSIGMSAVKLEGIDLKAAGGIEIHVSGLDLLDGTPVIDIKPYLPFADRIDEANAGWAHTEIKRYPVSYSDDSLMALGGWSEQHSDLKQLIEQMLALDPRPTSQRRASPLAAPESEDKEFAFRVLDFDVHWRVRAGAPHVFLVLKLPGS